MTLEEIRGQIERHLKTVYALLPDKLVSSDKNPQRSEKSRKRLNIAYENQDWEQVLLQLHNYCQTNNFADSILQEIEAAEQSFHAYESLGMKNALENLSEHEILVIGECLRATASGSFFPDYVFTTLFGLDREEVERVANEWPSVKVEDRNVGHAINNSMNMLWSYPHRKDEEWSNFISVPPQESYEIFNRWRVLTGRKNNQGSGKAESFHNLE